MYIFYPSTFLCLYSKMSINNSFIYVIYIYIYIYIYAYILPFLDLNVAILLPFLDVTRMSMSTVSFLAQLDSLPIECFPLT